MKKPTPQQIKKSGVLGLNFFDRNSMGFFNQKMTDFKTEWHDKDKKIVRIFAPARDNDGVIRFFTERFVHANPMIPHGFALMLCPHEEVK